MPDRLAAMVAALCARPLETAIVTDFDGTLAPIVENPAAAAPLPGAPALLHRLAGLYGTVAVVSGRPATFLVDKLGSTSPVVLAGLYGLERAVGEVVVIADEARAWVPVVAEAARRALAVAPPEAIVEHKGLAVTLHVRTAPDAAAWARSFAEAEAATSGLVVHPGRMSVELRPPVAIDKGTVIAELVATSEAACFIGDDVGDLPGFDALDAFERDGGEAFRVAVASAEAPADLLQRADLVLDGPGAVVDLLERLAEAPSG